MKHGSNQDLQLAFSLHRAGRFNEAAGLYRKIIKRNQKNFHALQSLGIIEASNGNLGEAASLMARSLSIQPPNPQFFENYATVLCQMGDYKAALEVCRKGLRSDNRNIALLYVSATSLILLEQLPEALEQFDKLLSVKGDHLPAIVERSTVLLAMKRYEAAATSIENAIDLDPHYAEVHLNKGALCGHLKRYDEALIAFEKAVTLKPALAQAWLEYGNTFHALARDEEALVAFDKCLALRFETSKVWTARGNTLSRLRRYDEAIAAYDRALATEPGLVEALLHRGNSLREMERYDEALDAYRRVVSLKPDVVPAWFACGALFTKLFRHEEAAIAYAQVLKIDPQYPLTKGSLLHQRMLCCDWEGMDEAIADIDRDLASGKLSIDPFGWQGLARSERSLQICAELYNSTNFPAEVKSASLRPSVKHDKVRIGYLCGELREQATSHLLVGVLERHDSSRFEVYGFDSGWNDQSDMRRRIEIALHRVIDISKLNDASAAAVIRENQIDVLVNLNGYFGKQRTGVFAKRPASIQVNYLGFPGTIGAKYIDYIIADRCVIPEAQRVYYTEKVVYLPNSYQANDRKKQIATREFGRAECGLPETGFVFCCFNNSYKILPETFNCWMRILKRVEGSVMWLLENNPSAASHLRSAAGSLGVDPQRLVFAERTSLPDHLARHRLAELFLDTLPYNAHTTASDALWAGLPVLTCLGATFAGRVCASLLNAVNLPELVATTIEDYERMAVELATNPEKLTELKRKLDERRLTTPLFDTDQFTKHIEAAYMTMYEREQAGLAPDHISIPT